MRSELTINQGRRPRSRAALAGAAVLLAGLCAQLAGAPAAGAEGCANADRPLGELNTDQLRSSVACLINADRRARGLRALRGSSKLYSPSRYHNRDMQENLHRLTHRSSNGQSATERIHRYGYTSGARRWGVGEILGEGWGTATPQAIMTGWIRSDAHRRIIRKASFRHFGIASRHGISSDASRPGALFTVDFGYRTG